MSTPKQEIALRVEARKRGFPVPKVRRIMRVEAREYETVRYGRPEYRISIFKIRGRPQCRYRDVETGRFIRKPEKT